ncbi:MAG: MoaD/ThiS family protein [Verrucomicrobiales bacterium]|jgi:molybdopterin synthase sulfur carrier subunit|nr:MoaD/ThiS family protein [Verrucomicrobiales bacterium]MBP9223463.1 MoaD/ThiS family protein [Verrucomicrobiales bacterium]
MPTIQFTPNLSRQTLVESRTVEGGTVLEALEALFGEFPAARGYVIDDQGAVRQHVAIFVDGNTILDRNHLSDPVSPGSEVFIMQALSGG